MNSPLSRLTNEQLQGVLDECNSALQVMTGNLIGRPDLQEIYRDLMSADHMLETFTELALREPALMQEVLHTAVSMLTSAMTFESVTEEERKRRCFGNDGSQNG